MKPFCFSLSGIYESEGYAWEQAGKIWDLRELRGTDGYLDPETEQFLEAELGNERADIASVARVWEYLKAILSYKE